MRLPGRAGGPARPGRRLAGRRCVRPSSPRRRAVLRTGARRRSRRSDRPGLLRRQRWVEKKVRTDVAEVFGDRLRFVVCAGRGLDADADRLLRAGRRDRARGLRSAPRPAARSASPGRTTPGAGRPDGRCPAPRSGSPTRARSRSPGPGVMDGYHGRRADTEAALRPGLAAHRRRRGPRRARAGCGCSAGSRGARDPSDPAGLRSLATRSVTVVN